MGYLVSPARSVLFFIYFGDSGELKAYYVFTNILFVVVLGWFSPHSGRANWGHFYLSFPLVKHMSVSPSADSVGCQCCDWDLLFASLIKPSDLGLLSDSACICECRAWAKQMKRKSSCSVVLSYQEYKTCKGEISGVRVCLLYLK